MTTAALIDLLAGDELVSTSDAARILQVNKCTFIDWRNTGHFDVPPVQAGAGRLPMPLWTRSDVEHFRDTVPSPAAALTTRRAQARVPA